MMLILTVIFCGAKCLFLDSEPVPYQILPDTLLRIREPGRWLHDITTYGIETQQTP